MWCTESCAACSVACLEVSMLGKKIRQPVVMAKLLLLSLLETMLAKEAKTVVHSAVENT